MIKVDRKAFLSELSFLRSISLEKTLAPIFSTVRTSSDGSVLSLRTSDAISTLSASLEASGEWEGCVPLDRLYSLVRLFTADTVALAPKGKDWLEIKCGSGKRTLPTFPVTEFPESDRPTSKVTTVGAEMLSSLIKSVRFSILKDDGFVKAVDQKFTGFQISIRGDRLIVEATRKVTFATSSCPIEGPGFSAILPPQVIAPLLIFSEGEVEIGTAEGFMSFVNGNRAITTRTLIGKFPDFSSLIPEFRQKATVKCASLKSAISRAMLAVDPYAKKTYESLRLTFTKDSLLLETRGGSVGKSDEKVEIQSNLNGESIVFGAFGDQLLSWLSIAGEEGTIEIVPEMIRLSSPQKNFEASYIVCGTNLKEWQ